MNGFSVRASRPTGHIEIPPSKSHTLRALLFGMLGKGRTVVRKYLPSPDVDSMLNACCQFGLSLSRFADRIEIEGEGVTGLKAAEDVIDAGNSGQVLRFVGAVAALLPSYTVLTGDHSIRHNRPVRPLLEGLRASGAFAESTRRDGFAPIVIRGPIRGGEVVMDGSDSQPVSGLLIAASFAQGKTSLHINDPGEKPWIDLTLHWLDFLGLPYERTGYTDYLIPGGGEYPGFDYTVPGDFSSLAFPLVAAVITDSELTLSHVDMNDVQGDKKVIDLLISMGANLSVDGDRGVLTVHKGSRLKGMKIDVNDVIDAVPILAVVGCFAEGGITLFNGAIARNKECDRIRAITSELKKMGASIEEHPDGLTVHRSTLKGARVKTYRDHRMAMALTVAALRAEGETKVMGTQCIAKTYPGFAEGLRKTGVVIREEA